MAESTASKQMPRRDTIRFPTGRSLPDRLTLQSGGTRSVLIHKLSRAPAAFKAAAAPRLLRVPWLAESWVLETHAREGTQSLAPTCDPWPLNSPNW